MPGTVLNLGEVTRNKTKVLRSLSFEIRQILLKGEAI